MVEGLEKAHGSKVNFFLISEIFDAPLKNRLLEKREGKLRTYYAGSVKAGRK